MKGRAAAQSGSGDVGVGSVVGDDGRGGRRRARRRRDSSSSWRVFLEERGSWSDLRRGNFLLLLGVVVFQGCFAAWRHRCCGRGREREEKKK